ncbi:unnamed protein product [Amaranthus hypochondriacus]
MENTKYQILTQVDSQISRRVNGKRVHDASKIEAEKKVKVAKTRVKSFSQALNAFYKFTRPYSIYATIAFLLSTSLVAVENLSDFSPSFFARVVEGIIVIILCVIYAVGINQICDMEIDKINKPYLPLASGELSITDGILITTTSAVMSLLLAWRSGSPYLLWIAVVYIVAGFGYSVDLPMLRWKKYSFVATLSFVGARATVQTVFYLHIQVFFFGRPILFSNTLIFGIMIIGFFSVVTGLFKDIPDIEGDRRNGIKTLAVKLGDKKMFQICVCLLEATFIFGILVGGIQASTIWSRCTMVVGHSMLGIYVWYRAKSIDIRSSVAAESFYMLLWQVMSVEYLLIPLLR